LSIKQKISPVHISDSNKQQVFGKNLGVLKIHQCKINRYLLKREKKKEEKIIPNQVFVASAANRPVSLRFLPSICSGFSILSIFNNLKT